MVDNITIECSDVSVFSHFTYDFAKQRGCFNKIQRNHYFLTNGVLDSNEFHLRIERSRAGLKISGSIRKWYLGALSDRDLHREEFAEAMRLLADCLGIPYKILCLFRISRIEIGICCPVAFDCSSISSMFVGFKNSSYKPLMSVGYLNFRNKSRKETIKLYDKKSEIISNMGIFKDVEELGFIKRYKDNNLIRVEFTVNTKMSIRNKVHIQSVGELVHHYHYLLCYFLKGIRQLHIAENNGISFHPKTGSVKELTDFLQCYALQKLGIIGERALIEKLPSKNRKYARKKLKQLRCTAVDDSPQSADILPLLKWQAGWSFRPQKELHYN